MSRLLSDRRAVQIALAVATFLASSCGCFGC
jgi:hypothetical protein